MKIKNIFKNTKTNKNEELEQLIELIDTWTLMAELARKGIRFAPNAEDELAEDECYKASEDLLRELAKSMDAVKCALEDTEK